MVGLQETLILIIIKIFKGSGARCAVVELKVQQSSLYNNPEEKCNKHSSKNYFGISCDIKRAAFQLLPRLTKKL